MNTLRMKSPYGSVQFSSVIQSCLTLCDPMNQSTPGLPVHHQLPEFTQTHVHWAGDAIQPSHPLLSPSPLAPNPSQHQRLFQRVDSSHVVAKVLEFHAMKTKADWCGGEWTDVEWVSWREWPSDTSDLIATAKTGLGRRWMPARNLTEPSTAGV